jgi:hypothetical protein
MQHNMAALIRETGLSYNVQQQKARIPASQTNFATAVSSIEIQNAGLRN